MSQCGNNNELAHHHVPCDRLLQKAYWPFFNKGSVHKYLCSLLWHLNDLCHGMHFIVVHTWDLQYCKFSCQQWTFLACTFCFPFHTNWCYSREYFLPNVILCTCTCSPITFNMKREIPKRTPGGLKCENKMYKPKRSICILKTLEITANQTLKVMPLNDGTITILTYS